MLALLSSPVRRWLLGTLLLPLVAYLLSKVGLYLQKRNGGAPTRLSRALLGLSGFARRRSGRGDLNTDSAATSIPASPPVSGGVETTHP
jgi:hypothetical protein